MWYNMSLLKGVLMILNDCIYSILKKLSLFKQSADRGIEII